ncbi:MAG: HD domain-containing protein [Myxococcales bacterium FL481]|nr:MAG: HD domain-containing protein [Myxococcales bacterium FL481]
MYAWPVILRDPVHHLISFTGAEERLVVDLMDTPEVQRLRRIRALGLASLAFPGGEHSRFAHAVGSAYVMRRYLEHVGGLSSQLAAHDRIAPETGLVALAAALLHDLGHGPYSHTFEDVVPQARSHEAWTEALICDPSTSVHRVLVGVDATMPGEVAALVRGRHPIAHLARAVSGTFDVDRCDYLMRDSYMTGVRYGLLDLDWLLASLRLHCATEGAPATLAVDGEKGLTAVEGYFLARLYMYRQVYLHKAVRAADAVMRSLFRRLHRIGAPAGTPTALADAAAGRELSPQRYLELDDHLLEVALATWSNGSDPVAGDLAERLRSRRLFKTMSLRPDVDVALAEAQLSEIVRREGLDPDYYARIDRVEIHACEDDDESLVVLHGGARRERLVDASPVLRGLRRERFVHCRALFPECVRSAVRRGLAEFV